MEDEIKCLFCLGAVEDDIKVKPFAGRASGKVDCETNLNGFFMEMAGHEACWYSSVISSHFSLDSGGSIGRLPPSPSPPPPTL